MRMILQGLILSGVIWILTSVSAQNVSIAGIQVQLANLTESMKGVPELKTEVATLQTSQIEMERRIAILERERSELSNVKRLRGFAE